MFVEQCVQAALPYIPTVLVCSRSRFTLTGLTNVDDRKGTKPGKKEDKAPKPVDDTGALEFHQLTHHRQQDHRQRSKANAKINRTRNSSGDEIANVNFLYDDIVHILQNTIDSCINAATDRRGYVLEHRFTKFSDMHVTQSNGHYAVQGHSRSPILVPIESSYTTF